MSHSFIQNYCWITLQFHIMKDERLVSKMEGKTNISRRLKQFDGLTWLNLAPIFYDRCTPVTTMTWQLLQYNQCQWVKYRRLANAHRSRVSIRVAIYLLRAVDVDDLQYNSVSVRHTVWARIGAICVGTGGRGAGPLTFLFEGPNMTVAPSLLKNAAPSLS